MQLSSAKLCMPPKVAETITGLVHHVCLLLLLLVVLQ